MVRTPVFSSYNASRRMALARKTINYTVSPPDSDRDTPRYFRTATRARLVAKQLGIGSRLRRNALEDRVTQNRSANGPCDTPSLKLRCHYRECFGRCRLRTYSSMRRS